MYNVLGSLPSENRYTEQKKYLPCPAHKGVFRKFKIAPQNPTRKQTETEPDYEKNHYATT